jgi:hypothetical protein
LKKTHSLVRSSLALFSPYIYISLFILVPRDQLQNPSNMIIVCHGLLRPTAKPSKNTTALGGYMHAVLYTRFWTF